MGYEHRSLEIHWNVSRHNDERDREDDALSEELRQRIQTAIDDPTFARMDPWVM